MPQKMHRIKISGGGTWIYFNHENILRAESIYWEETGRTKICSERENITLFLALFCSLRPSSSLSVAPGNIYRIIQREGISWIWEDKYWAKVQTVMLIKDKVDKRTQGFLQQQNTHTDIHNLKLDIHLKMWLNVTTTSIHGGNQCVGSNSAVIPKLGSSYLEGYIKLCSGYAKNNNVIWKQPDCIFETGIWTGT